MKWVWWWNKGEPKSSEADREATQQQLEEAQEKLERVIRDDDRVARLVHRTDKVVSDNNFALTIRRALGVRP
jgi:hypothetical protein